MVGRTTAIAVVGDGESTESLIMPARFPPAAVFLRMNAKTLSRRGGEATKSVLMGKTVAAVGGGWAVGCFVAGDYLCDECPGMGRCPFL